MSTGGATLLGSYSGETGTISEVGFTYGSSSGSLYGYSAASGTSSPFSVSVNKFESGTTYYYRAYVKEYNASTGQYELREGEEKSFTTVAQVASASVVTSAAGSITSGSAALSGSFSGATGTVTNAGFAWGTSAASLTNLLEASLEPGLSEGNINQTLSGLDANTKYYYKAYVLEWSQDISEYVYKYGEVRSFTTEASAPVVSGQGYLGCYEMPALSGLSPTFRESGTKTDRDDRWFSYNTSNSKRQIATHTYTHPSTSKQTRNYTVLYDESKYAPVWTAHVMHKGSWPDKNVGRNDGWTNDPAISLTQQSGLDNAGSVGFSRGHLVASDYRQSTVGQNKQTFYYSNQAPQWQNSFNGGIWSTLEQEVKSHAPEAGTRDTLYVVTGVLYEGSISTKPSGSLNVPIPSHFYKCLMMCSFNSSGTMTAASGVAYVFTNEAHSGSPSAFTTTIDAIESRAGFDFFAGVPPGLQSAAESSSTPLW